MALVVAAAGVQVWWRRRCGAEHLRAGACVAFVTASAGSDAMMCSRIVHISTV
jgi:hypothetical protein